MSFRDISLMMEALIKIYGCKFRLSITSFKQMSERYPSTAKSVSMDENTLKSIRKAVRRASKFTWWKNKCLVNTLCARRMLNKRSIPSEAFLGLRKDNSGNTIAHAWLLVNSTEIVAKESDYIEIYSF